MIRALILPLSLSVGLNIGLAHAVAAETSPAALAEAAAARLDQAGQTLAAAEKARDRVKALTETLRAFEDGLEAMREG
ncbi:MAG: peptidase M23, partial [Pseudomonadota bacterium]|nr:peptidase M23 [Pseudomonadota bacterium]